MVSSHLLSRSFRHVAYLFAAVLIVFPSPADSQQPYTASLELVAENLTHPLMLAEPPDESGRRFVVDQTGQIWIITADGKRLETPFLNIADSLVQLNQHYDERGLLGLAFHPQYSQNGRFFVFYSAPLREQAPDNFDHTNRISEFRVSDDNPDRADPGSEKILLEIDHPYTNHNAGTIAFGPDSMLYIALGDGGHRDDQDRNFIQGHVDDWYELNDGGNGQDIENNLLGSIIRIDVDEQAGGRGYSVPQDNPFTGIPGVMGEVFAYGLRNPYRFSFDMGGQNQLILGDAGQNLYEEIDLVTRGGNYGWNVMEGRHCFNAASPTSPFDSCPGRTGRGHPVEGDTLILPVIEMKNSGYFDDGLGLVVIGGYVYRGDILPDQFSGKYFFGMYSRGHRGGTHLPGRIFVATREGVQNWPFEELRISNLPDGQLGNLLLSFGQDRKGEVYVLVADNTGPTGNTGKVYKLVTSE